MRELLGRLSALDPDAENAVRVIDFFDALVAAHSGLDGLIRGAAVLAGVPAGLDEADRHIRLRIGPDGQRLDPVPLRDTWAMTSLGDSGTARVWIERTSGLSGSDAMILERLSAGVQLVLDRTRTKSAFRDPALVEVLLDGNATDAVRRDAARKLGMPDQMKARVVATLPIGAEVEESGAVDWLPSALLRWHTRMGRVGASIVPVTRDWTGDADTLVRAGIGPVTGLTGLPKAWQAAFDVLRLTAAGTLEDPGPRQLRHDTIGGLALLPRLTDREIAEIDDVRALESAERLGPWTFTVLEAITSHKSLRQAASSLHMHHSTLSERLRQLELELGYSFDAPEGRGRLYIALALRRLQRSSNLP